MSKPCKNCGGTARTKSGHCKACHKQHVRNWNERNAERLKTVKAAWAKANVVKQREWYRAWLALNPEKARAASEAWAKRNASKIVQYRVENAERLNAHKREYYRNNTDKYRVYVQNRLKRVRATGAKIPTDIVRTLMGKQEGLCVYCGADIQQRYHIDHIMPLALGGLHTAENIQLLCPRCNLSKGCKHPSKFAEERSLYA